MQGEDTPRESLAGGFQPYSILATLYKIHLLFIQYKLRIGVGKCSLDHHRIYLVKWQSAMRRQYKEI